MFGEDDELHFKVMLCSMVIWVLLIIGIYAYENHYNPESLKSLTTTEE